MSSREDGFNTLIWYISDNKLRQYGFAISSIHPNHCFQFADDAGIITSLQHENQILLNHFKSWCTWVSRVIRANKCLTFGIKKPQTSSPKLVINEAKVPTIENGKSFKYLG